MSPLLAIEGFQRIHLEPRASEHVVFRLDPRMLSRVDSQGNRAVAPGTYRICLGGSQPGGDGDHLAAEFTIEGTLGLPR